jgi:hypothetical protein
MNFAHVKLLSWAAALVTGLALGWTVFAHLQGRDTRDSAPTRDELRAVLDNVPEPEPPKEDRVDYERVLAAMRKADWTGRPPRTEPEVADTGPEPEVEEPPKRASELLEVIHLRVDSGRPERSMCFVRYVEMQLSMRPDKEAELKEGDSLPVPFAYVRVDEIEPDGVWFAFDDDARDREFLMPPGWDGDEIEIEVLAPGESAQLPDESATIPSYVGSLELPERTTRIGQNTYLIGEDDREYLEQNFHEMLAQDVRTRRWKNPQTGRYEGIELRSIAAGSVARNFGAREGDVIKSINGHPVSSKPDAIAFVKKESKEKAVEEWNVVVENRGAERTVVIKTPQ